MATGDLRADADVVCCDQGRLAVLNVCTKRVPLHQDVCLQDLADQTELFSGADLENLCKEVNHTLTARIHLLSFCPVNLDSCVCVCVCLPGGSSGPARGWTRCSLREAHVLYEGASDFESIAES